MGILFPAAMPSRHDLIARKQAVRRALEQARRELTRLRAAEATRANQRQISKIERKIEILMAEEYRLRLAIDRTND